VLQWHAAPVVGRRLALRCPAAVMQSCLLEPTGKAVRQRAESLALHECFSPVVPSLDPRAGAHAQNTPAHLLLCDPVLFLSPVRTYTYTVRADTAGNKTNNVQLVTPDANNTNNVDNKTVSVLVTCGDPLGNNQRPPCPNGAVYGGNDSITMVSADLFNTTCCVSGQCTGRAQLSSAGRACDGARLLCTCLK
jgi:hypothetical protein